MTPSVAATPNSSNILAKIKKKKKKIIHPITESRISILCRTYLVGLCLYPVSVAGIEGIRFEQACAILFLEYTNTLPNEIQYHCQSIDYPTHAHEQRCK